MTDTFNTSNELAERAWMHAIDGTGSCAAMVERILDTSDPAEVATALLERMFSTRRAQLPGVFAVASHLVGQCGAQPMAVVRRGVGIPDYLVIPTALAMGQAEAAGVAQEQCGRGTILHYLMDTVQHWRLIQLLQPGQRWQTQAWINQLNRPGLSPLAAFWQAPADGVLFEEQWTVCLGLLHHGADPLGMNGDGRTNLDHMMLARAKPENDVLFSSPSAARDEALRWFQAAQERQSLHAITQDAMAALSRRRI